MADEDDLPELDDEEVQNDAPEDDEGQGGDDGQGEDDAGEDDEGQGESEGQEEVAAEPARRSRATSAVLAAKTAAKEALAEKQRLENENRELRARVEKPAETAEQEAQRLALMTTEERLDYKMAKLEQARLRDQEVFRFQQYDTNDRAKFAALKASNKLAARYEEKVEAERNRVMQVTGTSIDRENILAFLIGKDVMTKGGKASEEQRKAGKDAIRRQTTRPSSGGRSDEAAPRGGRISEQEARRRRLENATF